MAKQVSTGDFFQAKRAIRQARNRLGEKDETSRDEAEIPERIPTPPISYNVPPPRPPAIDIHIPELVFPIFHVWEITVGLRKPLSMFIFAYTHVIAQLAYCKSCLWPLF
jgi:hypothetical protein